MNNYKLTISYDGTRYNGWQKQNNTINTIQEKLESIISEILNESVELIGSGRTDAGVHAFGQVANFKTEQTIDTNMLKEKMNDLLQKDISILEIESVDERFHARYLVTGKQYYYRIWNRETVNVFERKYAYHEKNRLNIDNMKEAAQLLVGTHDFKSFTSEKSKKKSTIKTIHSIEILDKAGMVEIGFHGNGFLYHMVRIIAGTLIEVGKGEKTIQDINDILTACDRKSAGFTAPPQGLFLKRVLYK